MKYFIFILACLFSNSLLAAEDADFYIKVLKSAEGYEKYGIVNQEKNDGIICFVKNEQGKTNPQFSMPIFVPPQKVNHGIRSAGDHNDCLKVPKTKNKKEKDKYTKNKAGIYNKTESDHSQVFFYRLKRDEGIYLYLDYTASPGIVSRCHIYDITNRAYYYWPVHSDTYTYFSIPTDVDVRVNCVNEAI